jgi:hypothetical protein
MYIDVHVNADNPRDLLPECIRLQSPTFIAFAYTFIAHTHTHTHTHDHTHIGNDKLENYQLSGSVEIDFKSFTSFIKHVNTLSMWFPTKPNFCKKGVIFAVLMHS